MTTAESGRLRPDWRHDEVRIELAKNVWYVFRTLSFHDVHEIWPHIVPLRNALFNSKPLAWAEHVEAILRVICPVLAKNEEHMELIRPAHIDALIEFYGKQDWRRIQKLGGVTAEERAAKDAGPSREAIESGEGSRMFMTLCIVGATVARMSIVEFCEQRFEFCADAILLARQEMEDAENAKKVPPEKFFQAMSVMLPTQKIDPTNKPAYILEMEELAKRPAN